MTCSGVAWVLTPGWLWCKALGCAELKSVSGTEAPGGRALEVTPGTGNGTALWTCVQNITRSGMASFEVISQPKCYLRCEFF